MRERYGALYYLGVGGLFVLIGMLSLFGWGAWTLRSVWVHVYVLHDASQTEDDRVEAAYALGQDGRVNQRQLWDIAMRKPLPTLARYVVAESLTGEAATADPEGYGASVSKSEEWPVWLRLLLTRPMAYCAALNLPVARGSLAELKKNPDHAIALWATYALAAGSEGDPAESAALRREAKTEGLDRKLAELLVGALDTRDLAERLKELDKATRWLRLNHPVCAEVWKGWRMDGDRVVREKGAGK